MTHQFLVTLMVHTTKINLATTPTVTSASSMTDEYLVVVIPRDGQQLAAMPVEYLTPRIEDRALEVQLLLADRGQHRGPSIPDLIIAATAELCGLAVLHVDKDFETISAITGQSTVRLALPGGAAPA